MLLAAALTWAAHSSVAVVLVIMSLAAQASCRRDAAFALTLGRQPRRRDQPGAGGRLRRPAARRLGFGNLINRALGVGLGLAALPWLGPWIVSLESDNARAVADFHTAFNLALAAAFFPWLGVYARWLHRAFPDRNDPADPSRPLYLDPAARETPIVALGAAAREALRLADALEAMLRGARKALDGERAAAAEVRRLDDVLDRLNAEIRAYLTGLDSDAMSEADHRRLSEVMTFAMNLELAGDVVEQALIGHALKRLQRGWPASRQAEGELAATLDRLIYNLRAAAALLMTDDPRAAEALAEEKKMFRDIEASATRAHFERMREGGEAAQSGALHLDLVRDMKLVNSHIVAAAAYPVLERAGKLLASRVADDGIERGLMRRAAILAGVLLAAAPAQAAKSVYGVVMKTLANPYWGAMEQGVREGARKAGVEYFLLGVESDSAPAQLEICNRVLQAKPAALIAAAVDGAALLPCLKQANAMKIPVADLGDTLDPEVTRKAGVEIAFHIGVDDAAAGAAAADYLAGALGKAAKGPVLALEGAAGDAPRQQRMRGFARGTEEGRAGASHRLARRRRRGRQSVAGPSRSRGRLRRRRCGGARRGRGGPRGGPGQAGRGRGRRRRRGGQIDSRRPARRGSRAVALWDRRAGGGDDEESPGGRESRALRANADFDADQTCVGVQDGPAAVDAEMKGPLAGGERGAAPRGLSRGEPLALQQECGRIH